MMKFACTATVLSAVLSVFVLASPAQAAQLGRKKCDPPKIWCKETKSCISVDDCRLLESVPGRSRNPAAIKPHPGATVIKPVKPAR